MEKAMAWSLVIMLVCVLVGCQSPTPTQPHEPTGTEEPEPGEEEAVDDEEDVVEEETPAALASFRQIEEMRDIIAHFSLLEFSFSDEENEVTITYEWLEKGRVEETAADCVSITIAQDGDVSDFELWMDEDGNALQLVVDGEDMGAMGPMVADMMLGVVVIPFTLYASQWEDAFVQTDGFQHFGWTSVSRQQSRRDFGAGELLVHQYRFRVTYDDQDLDYAFEVAELNDRSFFVGWEVDMSDAHKSAFRVTQVIPR